MRALSAVAVAVAITVAGCGSSTAGGTTDPATIAPASTLAYVSFELEPDDPDRDGFDAAFGKLLGPGPRDRLGELFTRAVQTSGRLTYQDDMKPWLGKTATLIVTKVRRERVDFALLVASKDDDKAREAIAKDLSGTRNVDSSYRGVDYRLMPGGTANGVLEGFLVAGTNGAFRAVVDAVRDENVLAAAPAWKRAVGDRDAGKVALGYVDAKAVLQSLAAELPGAQSVLAPLLVGLVDLNPFVATLEAAPDRLVVDVTSPGTQPDPRGPGAASTEMIEGFPADAWFALALPQVGQALNELADALQANPLVGAQYRRFSDEVQRKTGLDLDADVLPALGDVGVFARGAGKGSGGALVVESPNPRTLARTVGKLPALVRRGHGGRLGVAKRGSGFDVTSPQMPHDLQVRVDGGRALAGYGSAATRAALRPAVTLGSTDLFRRATAAIGGRPAMFAGIQPALAAKAASPHHRRRAHLRDVFPGADALSYAAVGARRDGGLDVVRAVLGLR